MKTLQTLVLSAICAVAFSSCIKDLPTSSVKVPEVGINDTELKEDRIIFRGQVTDSGNGNVSRTGFIWDTEPGVDEDDNYLTVISGDLIFEKSLLEPEAGVVYYVKAFAQNEEGMAHSEELSVTFPE